VHVYARGEFTCLAQAVALIIMNNTFYLFNYSITDSIVYIHQIKPENSQKFITAQTYFNREDEFVLAKINIIVDYNNGI